MSPGIGLMKRRLEKEKDAIALAVSGIVKKYDIKPETLKTLETKYDSDAGDWRMTAVMSFRPAATAVVTAFSGAPIARENEAVSTRTPGTQVPSDSSSAAASGSRE